MASEQAKYMAELFAAIKERLSKLQSHVTEKKREFYE